MTQEPAKPHNPTLSQFMDRRAFLRTGAALGAGLYLGTSKSIAAQTESGERVLKLAIVGCGAQGERLVECSKEIEGIQFVAICDLLPANRKRRGAVITYKWGKPNEYTDFDEMLEKEKEVDAVLIATPDFLHAPFTRKALEAGKAVYCEKMMSNTIEAAADMVKAQRETGGILQIGHQRHSNPRYLHLRDNVLGQKLLGRVTHCYGQWNRGVSQSKMLEVPKGKDFEVDPALLSKYGYNNMEEFLNWRWFSKYGGGPISDLGAHQIDLFNWFFKTTPVSVMAMGDVDYYDGTNGKPKFELPDNVMAMYEYKGPEGVRRCYYQVLTTTGSQGYYEKLMGIDGSVVVSESPTYNQVYREPSAPDWGEFAQGDNPLVIRAGDALKNKFWEHERTWEKPKPKTYAMSSLAAAVADVRETKALEAWQLPVVLKSPPHAPHLANFYTAVRKKDPSLLNCNVEEAYRACVTVLKCYESMRSGCKYEFKAEDFTV